MNKRVTRALAVLGCVVALSATTAVIVQADTDGASSAAPAAAGTAGMPSAEVLKYWSDSKAAITPLLLHVRELPAAIAAVQEAGGSAPKAQLKQAAVMAESFATARDLVGRISVPPSAPSGVGELFQLACQLYRQSALALTEVEPAMPGPASLTTAQRAASLQTLGDRLFDQARRVLHIDAVGKDQAPVEYQYPAPVPAVADLTGEPAAAQPPTLDLDENLRSAALLISQAGAGTAGSPDSTFRALRNIAHGLEADPTEQGEDVLGARLAIALALLAEAAKLDGQPRSADALLTLSTYLWNQARTLNLQPHPALQQLDAPALPRSEVWTGGAFDGAPPALEPGQDIGSGLPGGLPVLDPAQILRG